MGYWNDYDYPRSRRIKPAAGIQTSGKFGTSWWGKRWLEVLGGFDWGNRLSRGRTYARGGQVVAIEILAGRVDAKVQGSRPTPYKVMISLQALSDETWDRVFDQLAEEAGHAALLLAGEMPAEIEEVFTKAASPIFPSKAQDLVMTCTCPDWAIPCKHLAAVFYLIAERFDEDPFTLFQLRGRSRDQLMAALRSRRATADSETPPAESPAEPVMSSLFDELDRYYHAPELNTITIHIAQPPVGAPLLRALGPAPAGADGDLRAIYQTMSEAALNRAFGGP